MSDREQQPAEDAPDPVVKTLPKTELDDADEPEHKDEADHDQETFGAVFPVGGPMTGTVLPPADPSEHV